MFLISHLEPENILIEKGKKVRTYFYIFMKSNGTSVKRHN